MRGDLPFYDVNFLLGPLTIVFALGLLIVLVYGFISSKNEGNRREGFFGKFGVYPYDQHDVVYRRLFHVFLGEKHKLASIYNQRNLINSRAQIEDGDEKKLTDLEIEEKKVLDGLKSLVEFAAGARRDLTIEVVNDLGIGDLFQEDLVGEISRIKNPVLN